MEIQLNELIERIKNEGVGAAEAEAAEILRSANDEKMRIIADANAEAEGILRSAREETERIRRASEDAIRQAGRNLLISFRESVCRELEAAVGAAVREAYSADVLGELIPKTVEAWAKNPDAEDMSVLLSAEDLSALETSLLAALKERMKNGVMLKANDSFDGGFRIAVRDGAVYYDYSADEVVDMMSSYLSPRVTALMKEAENG